MEVKNFILLKLGDELCETIGVNKYYFTVIGIERSHQYFMISFSKFGVIRNVSLFSNIDNSYNLEFINNLSTEKYKTFDNDDDVNKFIDSLKAKIAVVSTKEAPLKPKTDEEISNEFTIDNIKLNKRQLMKKYHPDKHIGREKLYTELFKKIKKSK